MFAMSFFICHRLFFDFGFLNICNEVEKDNCMMKMNFILVGGVAQWLERRSLAGDFPCPALDLQLMDDH